MTEEILAPVTDAKDVMPAKAPAPQEVTPPVYPDDDGPIYGFHTSTGYVQTYKSTKAFVEDNVYKEWAKIPQLPKESCRHCYGRGHNGRDTKTGKFYLCRCIYKRR